MLFLMGLGVIGIVLLTGVLDVMCVDVCDDEGDEEEEVIETVDDEP